MSLMITDILTLSAVANNPVSASYQSVGRRLTSGELGPGMPPLAVFNTMGAESQEILGDPHVVDSDLGGHGEILEAAPPQPIPEDALYGSPPRSASTTPSPRGSPQDKRVLDYLRTVTKRVQSTDLRFRKQNLPYRFRVESDNDEKVVLVVSILDKRGRILKNEVRDVTNDNFGRLMDDISTGKGLIIDDCP